MIVVRPYSKEDKPVIQAMHSAMGIEYEQPDWSKMLCSGVVEIDGSVVMAALLRKTAETYLLFDPMSARKRDRLGQFLALHNEMLQPAKRAGLEDFGAFLPPTIEPDFGKLLMRLGWKKALWPHYFLELK